MQYLIYLKLSFNINNHRQIKILKWNARTSFHHLDMTYLTALFYEQTQCKILHRRYRYTGFTIAAIIKTDNIVSICFMVRVFFQFSKISEPNRHRQQLEYTSNSQKFIHPAPFAGWLNYDISCRWNVGCAINRHPPSCGCFVRILSAEWIRSPHRCLDG